MHLTPHLINRCVLLAKEAGELIMRHYRQDGEVRAKEDRSPVTDADMASHHHLLAGLQSLTPDIPIVSEEAPPPQVGARYWLVDPLDGTRSFVQKDDQFSVNIGLVENSLPVFGVIGLPVLGSAYWGGEGIGAWRMKAGGEREPIRTRTPPAEGWSVVKSASFPSKHMRTFLDLLQPPPAQILGLSSALKFCLIAEGNADCYPRLGRTMEWDTAAGHALLNAAGGRVERADGEALHYGKPGYENPHFVAYGFRK